MIKIQCSAADAYLLQTETLTAGMVNLPVVKFEFSSDWDGLGKTAVIRAGEHVEELLITANQIIVPASCMAEAGVNLIIGVYGGSSAVELPTVWCACGEILDGTDPSFATNHTEASASEVAQMLGYAQAIEDYAQTLDGNVIRSVATDISGANAYGQTEVIIQDSGIGANRSLTFKFLNMKGNGINALLFTTEGTNRGHLQIKLGDGTIVNYNGIKLGLDTLDSAVSDANAAELLRAAAEQLRVQAEDARVLAENSRADAESDRELAEDQREANETTRQANETTRLGNEESRDANEGTRIANEEARETNENTRQSNEQSRSNAETARVNAETARATEFAQWQSEEESFGLKSEGYAVGEQDGVPVGSDSPYYQNNAKYYAESAGASKTAAEDAAELAESHEQYCTIQATKASNAAADAERSRSNAYSASSNAANAAYQANNAKTSATNQAAKSEGFAVGQLNGTDVDSDSPYYHNNAKYYAEQAEAAAQNLEGNLEIYDLLDKANIVLNNRLSTTNTAVAQSGSYYTQYITVEPGKTYRRDKAVSSAYYRLCIVNSDGTFSRYLDSYQDVTIQEGESKLRFSGYLNELETDSFVEVGKELTAIDIIARNTSDLIKKSAQYEQINPFSVIYDTEESVYKNYPMLGPAIKLQNYLYFNCTTANDNYKVPLTGSASRFVYGASGIKYSSIKDAYVDKIDGFKVGHYYRLDIKLLSGSCTLNNPNNCFAYLQFSNKDGTYPTEVCPPNKEFKLEYLPQAIFLSIRHGTYNDCVISVDIVDVTEQYAHSANYANNILRIFDKITAVGDSLMCGYTSYPTTTIDSATAKQRGANWVSYLSKDIGREINNIAVGGSTWKSWRNTHISSANVDTNCYLVGLGINSASETIGTSADIATDKANNANSVYGNADYVVRTLHEYNPTSHIFIFTIPVAGYDTINSAITYIANLYPTYCHLIDLRTLYKNNYIYGFINSNLEDGHYNPIAYSVMENYIKEAIESYIYSNYTLFQKVPYEL